VHEFSEGNIAADGVVHQNIHEGSQPKRTRVSRYHATTKWATTKDKQCPFSFTVFLGLDYFWYLSVGWATKDCSRHHGHPALNPKNANTGSTKLCEDDFLLTQQMQSAGCDYSAVVQTISECTGNLFDS
jgi:hypothetical protein